MNEGNEPGSASGSESFATTRPEQPHRYAIRKQAVFVMLGEGRGVSGSISSTRNMRATVGHAIARAAGGNETVNGTNIGARVAGLPRGAWWGAASVWEAAASVCGGCAPAPARRGPTRRGPGRPTPTPARPAPSPNGPTPTPAPTGPTPTPAPTGPTPTPTPAWSEAKAAAEANGPAIEATVEPALESAEAAVESAEAASTSATLCEGGSHTECETSCHKRRQD